MKTDFQKNTTDKAEWPWESALSLPTRPYPRRNEGGGLAVRRFGSASAPGSVPAPLAWEDLAYASPPAPTVMKDCQDAEVCSGVGVGVGVGVVVGVGVGAGVGVAVAVGVGVGVGVGVN